MLALKLAFVTLSITASTLYVGVAPANEIDKINFGVCSSKAIAVSVNEQASLGTAGGARRHWFEIVLQSVKRECISNVRIVAVANDGQHLNLALSKPVRLRKRSRTVLDMTSTSFFDETPRPQGYPFLQKTCHPKLFVKFILRYEYGSNLQKEKLEIAPMVGCSKY
jgi:hypothetical protein